jgi:hypothetical protein
MEVNSLMTSALVAKVVKVMAQVLVVKVMVLVLAVKAKKVEMAAVDVALLLNQDMVVKEKKVSVVVKT